MNVLVRGKNCKVSRKLRKLATEKVARVERLARDVDRADVEFSETGHHHSPPSSGCEVTVHLRRDVVRAHATAADAVSALDLTIEKLEYQLTKLKDKRIARQHGRQHARNRRNGEGGAAPSIPDFDDDLDDIAADTDDAGLRGSDPADRVRIVRQASPDVKPMSPHEAALQLDVLRLEFLLFSNSENGNAAVIYRRRDGDIGLIESPG